MRTQLREEGRFIGRQDGGGGAATVGDRGEAAGGRLSPQVAPHGPFADGEAPRGLGATGAALDRPHDTFA
jgi:hypothetical protein